MWIEPYSTPKYIAQSNKAYPPNKKQGLSVAQEIWRTVIKSFVTVTYFLTNGAATLQHPQYHSQVLTEHRQARSLPRLEGVSTAKSWIRRYRQSDPTTQSFNSLWAGCFHRRGFLLAMELRRCWGFSESGWSTTAWRQDWLPLTEDSKVPGRSLFAQETLCGSSAWSWAPLGTEQSIELGFATLAPRTPSSFSAS